LPKADIILVTHHHGDHLDSAAIAAVTKNNTRLIVTKTVFETLKSGIVLNNGDIKTMDGIIIEATPAYNSTADRDKFHPKGRDNGYVITLSNKRIYIAGDTENIPEMAALKNIDIAFLPMNQPYTMLPEQVVASVEMFNPKILYPYHFGESDITKLTELMAKYPKTEVRVKKMK
jgi:L-ascorbate metabolism protein UlaG (beta-lactamase superfamily)